MSLRTPTLIAIALLAALLTMPPGAQAQSRPLWGSLEPGDYDVGFRRLWDADRARIWPRSAALDSLEGNIARPIRVDVWYPAECDGAQPMPLGGYVNIDSPGPVFDDLVFLTHRWDEYSYRGLAEDSTSYDRLMSTETAACFGATAAPGRFPVVVYSAGWFNRAPDNTIIAEFLASHGFVVAAVPQLNPGLWTYNFRSDAQSVENQVRDLEVALALLSEQSFVDRRRVAAMGYSTGGDVALLLQGRSPLVDAVVGLDASWSLGPGNDVSGSPFFVPARHRVPILVARRPTEEGTGANAVLDSLTAAPRVVVEVPGSDHGSFSDDPAQRRMVGTDTAEHQATQVAVARTVLSFLRATLEQVGSFDGAELSRQYGARGLPSIFLAAEREVEPDGSER
jgi:dienelactone hydrolase